MRLAKISLIVSTALAMVMDTKKVTEDFLKSEIAETKYTQISPRTTHCLITTHSGMEFTGESTVADESNFDEKLGKQYAYQQAFESMYEPYGFLLRYVLQNQDNAEDGNAESWYQQQYAKIANEAGISSDVPAEDVLAELEKGINYMMNCASLEDLTVLLEDGLDDEIQAQKAKAILKEYFSDEADTLAHFGNI